MKNQIITYLKKEERYSRLGLKENFTVVFLAQGEYNQNFLISDGTKKMVFRLNYGSQLNLKNQIEYEYRALEWLYPSQRTPKPLYVDNSRQSFEQGLLVMNFLEGRPLNYRTDLREAATIFGEIHSKNIDRHAEKQFITEKNNLLGARIQECQQLLQPVFASVHISNPIKKLFDAALENCLKEEHKQSIFNEMNTWCLNNTEVNSHNFIIGPTKGWLIDWEKPVISHPCQDLTQFLASTTTLWRTNIKLDATEKQLFIEAYVKETSFVLEEIKEAINLYSPFLMLRALSWSAMAFDSYLSESKALKNKEIFKKIEQYLEVDFLENALNERVLL